MKSGNLLFLILGKDEILIKLSFELLVRVIFIPVMLSPFESNIVTVSAVILYLIFFESNNTHKENITAPTVPTADNPLNIKVKISYNPHPHIVLLLV